MYQHLIDGLTSDRSVCCGAYGTAPIRIRYIHCTGSEFRLVDCHLPYLLDPENEHNDWSVICSNGKL